MLFRWKTESTAEQSRAAPLFRPMLPHLPEMLVLYDALGAPTESPPEPVALALATGLGFGFGLGLATAWTPETPTGSGANGAAPCGAETAGMAVAGAAERTELREAAKASARATELVAAGPATTGNVSATAAPPRTPTVAMVLSAHAALRRGRPSGRRRTAPGARRR